MSKQQEYMHQPITAKGKSQSGKTAPEYAKSKDWYKIKSLIVGN